MTLEEFLASPYSNAWLYGPDIEVYVRKGKHFADGRDFKTLDVANIEVRFEKQHTGLFKAWLRHAEQVCPFEAVYIENVQNPVLDAFLIREGYRLVGHQCYMKNVSK